MATFAVMYNNVVTNTIVCEERDLPESIEGGVSYIPYTEENPAVIGLTWDGTTFQQPENPIVCKSEIPPVV
jgi:hypothetical protein